METITGYRHPAPAAWQGRVDDINDPDSFRWHQVIEYLNLEDDTLAPYSKENLNFCFLGYCSDLGVKINLGRSGAAKAPGFIRQQLANLPAGFSPRVRLIDAGDLVPHPPGQNIPASELARLTKKLLSLNLFPIVLGGGHDLSLGHFTGITDFAADKKTGIINFDAHFDLRPYLSGSGSGSMFLQIAESCKKNGFDFSYLVLGIQKYSNTKSLFNRARELGVSHILAADINDNDLKPVFQQLDRFTKGLDNLYITICSDVFSAAFAPGVSAPQPFGLHPETVLKILKHLLTTKKTISFDIAEVAPRFDQDNRTAKLAAIVIFALINKLAEI